MTIPKAGVRLAAPPPARKTIRITHIFEGQIHSTRYDGKRLVVTFVGPENRPRPTVYLTANSHALFLAYFLQVGDQVQIEGVAARDGFRGYHTAVAGLTEEEIAERERDAERDAARYKRYVAYRQQGHSHEAAQRLVQLTD